MDNQNLEFFNLHQRTRTNKNHKKITTIRTLKHFPLLPTDKNAQRPLLGKNEEADFPFSKIQTFFMQLYKNQKKMHNQQRFPKISTIKIKKRKKRIFKFKKCGFIKKPARKIEGCKNPRRISCSPAKSLVWVLSFRCSCHFSIFQFSK